MEIDNIYSVFQVHPSVQTDTRKLKKGDIFFALKGPNFNGNLFAKQALEAGASYVVVDEEINIKDDRIILVNDSLEALQQLAAKHRNRFTIPFIAITGSNGKTTTKELIHAVLSSHFITYTTEGNLNNHIGVPLTILKIKADAQMAVIEMGANHLHEIESYCKYTRPDFGLITNIGKAHLEGFGGEEGVKKGKGELFDYLREHGGTAFVNTDDANVLAIAENLEHKIYYGSSAVNETSEIISSDPFLTIRISGSNDLTITSQLVGNYNLPNILAAVTIGRYFKVPDEKIKSAIESYAPSNSRSQMIKKGTNTIIMDAYNANPGSMKAAIENFAAMHGDKKILILGDMKELGADTQKEHEQLVQLINQFKWKEVTLTGKAFSAVSHHYHSFDNADETREWFQKNNFADALILVKGSRSMQMEKVVAKYFEIISEPNITL